MQLFSIPPQDILGLYRYINHGIGSIGTAQDSGGILKRVSEKRFVPPLTRLYTQ